MVRSPDEFEIELQDVVIDDALHARIFEGIVLDDDVDVVPRPHEIPVAAPVLVLEGHPGAEHVAGRVPHDALDPAAAFQVGEGVVKGVALTGERGPKQALGGVDAAGG